MPHNEARERAVKLLRDSHLMVIATASPEGRPHAALISYVVDKSWNIYFLSKTNTMKTDFMAANPRISFTVGFNLPTSVQGWGRAFSVVDSKEREAAFRLLSEEAGKHDSFWPPPLKLDRLQDVIIKIDPSRIRAVQIAGDDPEDPNSLIFVDLINREQV